MSMASTAGARHLAESAIWLAEQPSSVDQQQLERTFQTLATAPLGEIAVQHMDTARIAAFLGWLRSVREKSVD